MGKGGLHLSVALPTIAPILPPSCKLENVSIYETHESPFWKLSLHSALKLHVYLPSFTVAQKHWKHFCINTRRCLVSLLWSLSFLLCILSSEFSHFPPKKQHMFSGHFYYSFPLTYLLFTDWDGSFVIFVSLASVAYLCPFTWQTSKR